MTAITSTFYVADLPDLTPEQLEKLHTWGRNSCCKFDVHMDGGALKLVTKRKKKATAREHMRLLRTNLLRWGADMPEKQQGWLRLISGDDNEEVTVATETKTCEQNATTELLDNPDDVASDGCSREEPVGVLQNSSLHLPRNMLTDGGRAFAALHQVTVH